MKKTTSINRRNFIAQTTLASGTLLFPMDAISNVLFSSKKAVTNNLEIHLFSKCLQFLDYKELCKTTKELGFDGVDLTVRPKGHVLPENVVTDLPKATELMKLYGLTPRMISTNVISANNATQQLVLETAKEQGFECYRTDWLKYDRSITIAENLTNAKTKFNALAALNKTIGISGGYQNHYGHYIGSAIWDLQQILSNINPKELGSQYDIMHASVEGGNNWEIGFELIKPNINSIVLKDFKWEKTNGKWDVTYVPIGEGMIDFYSYFSLLKKHNIQVPVSIHVEYDLGGAEKGGIPTMDTQEILSKIKKDIDYVRKVWKEVNQ